MIIKEVVHSNLASEQVQKEQSRAKQELLQLNSQQELIRGSRYSCRIFCTGYTRNYDIKPSSGINSLSPLS